MWPQGPFNIYPPNQNQMPNQPFVIIPVTDGKKGKGIGGGLSYKAVKRILEEEKKKEKEGKKDEGPKPRLYSFLEMTGVLFFWGPILGMGWVIVLKILAKNAF